MVKTDQSELTEQIKVIEWARKHEKKYPVLKLLHAPGKVTIGIIQEGEKTVAEIDSVHLYSLGAKRGVPDLHLPIGRQGYHSLYVEMKWGKNKLTDD